MSGTRGRSGGHNKLPKVVRLLHGTSRPSRENAAEPILKPGLPRPPSWLSAEGRREYRRLAKLLPENIAARSDGEALALAACALVEYRDADVVIRDEGVMLTRTTRHGTSSYRHPALSIRADAFKRYRDCLRGFGLDPQSRDGVSAVPVQVATDPAEKYFTESS